MTPPVTGGGVMYSQVFCPGGSRFSHLKRVFQSMYGCRLQSGDHFNDSTEVVELPEDHHDLVDTRHHLQTLLKVTCLNDTLLQPECELQYQRCRNYTVGKDLRVP